MGGGKTVVAAKIVRDLSDAGLRILFVAHRRELVYQALRKLVHEGIPIERIGLMMANAAREEAQFCDREFAPIQVASIQTFMSRLDRTNPFPFDIIIIDEAQRAAADSYRALTASYPDAKLLGLTGTPWRNDGRGLAEDFETMVVGEEVTRLIQHGYLLRPRVFTKPIRKLDELAKLRVVNGDYDGSQLGEFMNQRELVGDIVEHWSRDGLGRRTVVFASSVDHSRSIVERFRDVGVRAEHLDHRTPHGVRAAMLERLVSGATQVISNCSILSEGWDCPSLECVVLARPTLSRALYMQQACRCMRPYDHPVIISGPPVILDHAGNAIRHGLPDHVRSYQLTRDRTLSAAEAKVCPACNVVVPHGEQVCPNCGFVFPTRGISVHSADGTLAEVIRVSDSVIRTELRRIQAFARLRGFKNPWVVSVMRFKYGDRGAVMAQDLEV
jgi:DNA repair protein RadD